MADGEVTHHSVPEIVINHDGPEERRVGLVDDFGGKIELSTQQLRNMITLLFSVDPERQASASQSAPDIAVNDDGPEERRYAFTDDFGGKIELSTQQSINLISLLVSDDFWLITGL